MRKMLLSLGGAIALSLAAGSVQAAEVEVLHWWTSGGEAAVWSFSAMSPLHT